MNETGMHLHPGFLLQNSMVYGILFLSIFNKRVI